MTATGLPKTETCARFAARLGVARSTVTRAKQAGRLVMHESGNVLVEASLKRWHETKGGRDDVAARHAENRGAEIPEAAEAEKNATAARKTRNASATPDPETGTDQQAGTRASYKAASIKYENDAIKLEIALRRGHRYPLTAIRHEALGIGGTLRASIERLIDQTAPRLAVMTDPSARLELLRRETRRIARIIKHEFPRALRRMQREAKK